MKFFSAVKENVSQRSFCINDLSKIHKIAADEARSSAMYFIHRTLMRIDESSLPAELN